MEMHITKPFLFFIMTLICLNLTVEHWHNFESYDLENETHYEKFDQYLDLEIGKYTNKEANFKRTFEGQGGNTLLEERGKTRWIFKSFKSEVMILSRNLSEYQNFYDPQKAALYFYSFFIGSIFLLIFIFLYLSVVQIDKNFYNENLEIKLVNNQVVFLFFSYFLTIGYLHFIHFRGGEDWFSIFETLLLIIAIYAVLKNSSLSIAIYVFVCLLAPMVRESGIIISGIYLFYHILINQKIIKTSLLLPFISLIPYLISNYDLLEYYLVDGFILTTQSLPHQTTWHDLGSNFVGTMNAIFYNFIIFMIPLFLFFNRKSKIQLFLLFFIVSYFILLAVASVLDHLSTRFMPSVLIILYTYVGLKNEEKHN